MMEPRQAMFYVRMGDAESDNVEKKYVVVDYGPGMIRRVLEKTEHEKRSGGEVFAVSVDLVGVTD